MLSTATAAMASRIAWSPNQPMINVASGGPATQATETIARVFTMSAVRAPEWRRWANSIELPTPAGPPITTRAIAAIGSVVAIASTSGQQGGQPAAHQHQPQVLALPVGVRGQHQGRDEPAGVVDAEHPADLGGRGAVEVDQDQRQCGTEEGHLQAPHQRRGRHQQTLHAPSFDRRGGRILPRRPGSIQPGVARTREGLSSQALSVPASEACQYCFHGLSAHRDTLEQMFDWSVNLL